MYLKVSICWLQKRNIKFVKSLDAVILVKLCSVYDKNFILKSLALFRKSNRSQLCLQHIVFTSQNNSIVYINENLTLNNYKILNAAIRLRKKNRVTSAFTLRGLVYIKVIPGDKPMCFEDLNICHVNAQSLYHKMDEFRFCLKILRWILYAYLKYSLRGTSQII